MRQIFAAIIFISLAVPAIAQSVIPNSPGRKPTVAIRNATIYPVTSAPIANGTIVFANGVITAVGTDVTAPADAMVIDGTGVFSYKADGVIVAAGGAASRMADRGCPFRGVCEAGAENGKKVIVLDRPNPNGSQSVEMFATIPPAQARGE